MIANVRPTNSRDFLLVSTKVDVMSCLEQGAIHVWQGRRTRMVFDSRICAAPCQ
jgi:hypothetical protein